MKSSRSATCDGPRRRGFVDAGGKSVFRRKTSGTAPFLGTVNAGGLRLALWITFLLVAGGPRVVLGAGTEFHGFVLVMSSGRLLDEHPEGSRSQRFFLFEERLRLELDAWAARGALALHLEGDAIHDELSASPDSFLREAFLDFRHGPFDLRAGRQIVTWGVGDLVFINDVFPKDWNSFFTGRPTEYLKRGVDGARLRYSSGPVNVELLAIPEFAPDVLPPPSELFQFDPLPGVVPGGQRRPEVDFQDPEFALRLYRRVGGFDVSAYFYDGLSRTPARSLHPSDGTTTAIEFYPRVTTAGASTQGNALGGVVSLEAGIHDFSLESNLVTPGVPESRRMWLLGYRTEILEDFSIGVQYLATQDHRRNVASPPGRDGVGPSSYRDLVTFRLERLLRYQTLRLTALGFYSVSDGDFLWRPELSNRFSDRVSLTLGANVFGGSESTFFGQLDRNDAVYLSARFDFE